jgi:hypothetical protein
MAESKRCSFQQQDLVLFLYEELPAERRPELDRHLRECAHCRAELNDFRATLHAVDRARIPQESDRRLPADWDFEWLALRARLEAARGARPWPSTASLLKAAAVILLAGASFAAGRQWNSLGSARDPFGPAGAGPNGGTNGAGSLSVPEDPAARLQLFSEQTHGYLNRSRIVLLEVANGREDGDADSLRKASLTLLRETTAARRIAGQMADPRIEELLAQVEGLLKEISRLSGTADPTTVNRIRSELNSSGVLTQLELLSTGPAHLAQERS